MLIVQKAIKIGMNDSRDRPLCAMNGIRASSLLSTCVNMGIFLYARMFYASTLLWLLVAQEIGKLVCMLFFDF